MRPRHARRLAERQKRKRTRLTQPASTRCVVCGGEDGPECAPCTARHDHAIARAGDL